MKFKSTLNALAMVLVLGFGQAAAAQEVRSDSALSAIPLQRAVTIRLPMEGELSPHFDMFAMDSGKSYSLWFPTSEARPERWTWELTIPKGMKLVVTDVEFIGLSNEASFWLSSKPSSGAEHALYSYLGAETKSVVRERFVTPLIFPEFARLKLTQHHVHNARLRGYLIEDGYGFGFSPDTH